MSSYRPDIDGLRAIAVLSIFIFHLGIDRFAGGYIGVDIFFVISGYLITSIIVKEVDNDAFSVIRFYQRRVRRILPALVAVIIATLVTGFFLYNATLFEELGWSALATTVFSSNVLFFLETGYFDRASELKPLLHTWSLGVEEQFYILFPFITILAYKLKRDWYAFFLTGLALVSLYSCYRITATEPSQAFYLLHTRAWELLIGSLLAVKLIPIISSSRFLNLLSITGLALVLYSVFELDRNTSFPGLAALMPTIGTAIIIYSGKTRGLWVNSLLSSRPLVFVGLISYSLYLWHWPVIVFAKYYLVREPTNLELMIIAGFIFILATLSWKYVETPFRTTNLISRQRTVFITGFSASAGIALVSMIIIALAGMPARHEHANFTLEVSDDPEWSHWLNCENVVKRISTGEGLCDIGETTSPSQYLVWGDSYAAAYAIGIDKSAKSFGLNGKIATNRGCAPLDGLDRRGRKLCTRFNNSVLKFLEGSPNLETVILSGRWALWSNGKEYPRDVYWAVRDLVGEKYEGEPEELFETSMRRTVDKILAMGKRVALVKQVPETHHDVPSSSFIAIITGRDTNTLLAPPLSEFQQRRKISSDLIDTLEAEGKVMAVDPSGYICDDKACRVMIENNLLYRDRTHLSKFGAERVASSFDEIFKDL